MQLGDLCVPVTHGHAGPSADVTVDIVDRDHEASSLADQVIARLGLSDQLRTWTREAVEFPGVGDCDVLIVAALVGTPPVDKRRILGGLAERVRPGSLLLARGAHGLRTLLYPAIKVADIHGWTPLALAQPFTNVVSSVLVATRA